MNKDIASVLEAAIEVAAYEMYRLRAKAKEGDKIQGHQFHEVVKATREIAAELREMRKDDILSTLSDAELLELLTQTEKK